MPAVVRIGDPVSCGDVMAEGSGNVFANGIPISRESVDNTSGHCYAPTNVPSASPTVFVNGKGVIRKGDAITPHTCAPIPNTHGGNLANGSPDVFANGP